MKKFHAMVRYKDKRHFNGFRVEYPSVKNHEELTEYLLSKNNKKVAFIEIMYDTERYCDKQNWTTYRSLEEYLNRESKGFDASDIYKEKAAEQEKYKQEIARELRCSGTNRKKKSFMEIKIKRLTETAKIPERGSVYAAGYDLFADIEKPIWIWPHETVKISTGVAMEIPEEYFGGIFARSGLSTKEGLRPGNCVGVVDADYRGPICVALHNDSEEKKKVVPGQKIAQLVVMPFLSVKFVEAGELNNTVRGAGGFGSTGD